MPIAQPRSVSPRETPGRGKGVLKPRVVCESFSGADVGRGLMSCDRETNHMTQQKKLKKTIRARSEKTGESYAAARRQVLLARDKTPQEPQEEKIETPAPVPEAPAKAQAKKKGEITDESARKATGHGLDHWFAVLDAFGAAGKGHTAAAAHLARDHGVPGWHAQGITVAFERSRGLREMNQSCTGKFQVSVTKTVPVPVARVVEALKDAGQRAAWLADADPGLAQAFEAALSGDKPREVKSKGDDLAWLRFKWDGSSVEMRITGKSTGASVAVGNEDLPDAALVEPRRAMWKVALEGLRRYLGG